MGSKLERIAFVYAPGRAARLENAKQKKTASEFYYGALELESRGHEIGIYEAHWSREPALARRLLDRLFLWQMLPARTKGEVLLGLNKLCESLNSYDVIVGTTTPTAYGLAALRIAGRVRPPVIGIQCGLVNYRHSRRRRAVNGFVLRRTWTQLFGEGELDPVKELFSVPDDRVEVNQFGVDTAFWTPGDAKEDGYVLSVGNDARRDYELLVTAAQRINMRFVIVTKRTIAAQIPPNVEVVKGDWHAETLSDIELRSLYRAAQFVVLPLKDSVQPSGQSVCLQAMACGKPVILTDTRGLWSRETIRNGENVVLVPPGDAEAMANRIEDLWAKTETRERLGRAARETACREGNIEMFADRLANLCKRVTAGDYMTGANI